VRYRLKSRKFVGQDQCARGWTAARRLGFGIAIEHDERAEAIEQDRALKDAADVRDANAALFPYSHWRHYPAVEAGRIRHIR